MKIPNTQNPYCDWQKWKLNRWNVNWQVLVQLARNSGWLKGEEGRARTVLEVGIGPLDISMLPHISIYQAHRIVGVEPHPTTLAKAKEACPHCHLLHGAIVSPSYKESFVDLQMNPSAGSSALVGGWCPSPSQGSVISVPALHFEDVDDGEIDIINIDCEGAEWHVLEQMRSRPALLGIELWNQYPQRSECLNWLAENNYHPLWSSGPEGETLVFFREP